MRNLKDRSGGDIGVHVSISVAQALLAANVVDELRLVIAPRMAGHGRRLLDGLPPIRLEPIRNATSPTDRARGRHQQAIHLLDLPLPEPPPKGAEWIEAYRVLDTVRPRE